MNDDTTNDEEDQTLEDDRLPNPRIVEDEEGNLIEENPEAE